MDNRHLEDIISMEEETFNISRIETFLDDEKIKKSLENKYKDCFYILIMKSLTHEKYNNESKAKNTFYKIVAHLKELNNLLKREVGIVVATIDYLRNIEGSLNEPIIIEEDKSEILIEASTKDELTNLFLRDIFDITIKKTMSEFNRNNTPLSLIMIDIDDFKKVNDTYGHLKGDLVLTKIGEIINSSIREMDFAARYGGEELVILMPHSSTKKAKITAERIRKKIEKSIFDNLKVTVSIGISEASKKINTSIKLVETADFSLYKAKGNGKNRIEVYKHYD